MSKNMNNPHSPYIADRKLIPRMKQFIESCGSKPVVLSTMIDSLQQTYSDYRRKKRQAFAKSVEKAYSFIKPEDVPQDELEVIENRHRAKKRKKDNNQNRGATEDSDSDSSFSSETSYKEYKDTNSINSSITNLYSQNTPKRQQNNENIGWQIDKTPTPVVDQLRTPLSKNDIVQRNTIPITKGGGDCTPGRNSPFNAKQIEGSKGCSENEGSVVKDPSKRLLDDSDNLNSGVSTPVRDIGDQESKQGPGSVKSSKKTRRKTVSKESKEPEIGRSSITFSDIGGQESTLKEICKLLVHMRHPEVYVQLGVTPPKGFLLHGPPGCGKTLLANAIAGELELPFIKIAATELVSGVSGESEEKIRELFDRAMGCAPCILFLDEIDAITPKRETASKDMERRIVSQLLTCMDDLNTKANLHVLVIGATNRPDSLDPALRRAGRFDREISLGIPDEKAREGILKVLCKSLRLEQPFDYVSLAKASPGFVGADLTALAREAAMTAVNRVFDDLQLTTGAALNTVAEETPVAMQTDNDADPVAVNEAGAESVEKKSEMDSLLLWLKEKPPLSMEQLQTLCISMEDFQNALKHVQPSAKREGFATIPDVTWADIGALADVREELEMAILAPVRQKETFQALGLKNPPGILLAGPPGCGKTLLAKAVANESGINFISVKGPELLNMYVGESERAVRQVFLRARNSAPCVIFFDELDSICPKRSASADGGSSTRVVNQLLTEMDGLEERKQVFIMGATNRPDIIDPAILRPGRLDKLLYVGLPTAVDREDILKTITKNGTMPKFAEDVDLHEIANDERTQGLTGADLAHLVRESSMAALREFMNLPKQEGPIAVSKSHFDSAFNKVRPSVSKLDQAKYESMRSFTSRM